MKPRRPQNPWRLQKIATISVLALIMLNEKTQVNGTVVICGDGVIGSGETCDDGNSKKGDGCSATCQTETGFTCTTAGSACVEECGDGLNFKSVSTTTQCDDGGTTPGDGCSGSCVVETGWRCSGGSSSSPDTCVEICGDGYNFDTTGTWIVGDKCDDKNTIRYDGCFNCVVEDGWYCEPGSSSDTNTATQCYEQCMDGKDFGTFECDVVSGTDGCLDCAIVAGWECYGGSKSVPDTCTEICGDGIHHSASATACDDANYVDYDGCSSSCLVEDGFTLAAVVSSATAQTFDEDCDSFDYGYLDCDCGTTSTCDGCDNTCNVIKGYSCLPPDIPADGSDCTEICGDSINYDSESTDIFQGGICDDGNTRSNDGCSGTCLVETGFACSTTTSTTKDTCYEICGDGLDYKRYACEDGNAAENDGCSSSCDVNEGWYCYGGTKLQTDTCYEICGDGRNYAYWYSTDICDDGNDLGNDGCSSSCYIETGYDCVGGDYDSADYCYETCGDGIRFNALTTYCDDGGYDAGDGCDANCFVEEGFYCYGGDSTAVDHCYEDCGDSMRFTAATITSFCDDGNNEYDDGCDENCGTEEGWYCFGGSSSQPDTCYEVCGDGWDMGEFECDDGDNYDSDGCSSSCEVEDGYECYGGTTSQADTCYDICGDGFDMGPNECDDGDLTSIDGCKSDCTIRDGWYCWGGDHATASTCAEYCGDTYHYFESAGSMECDDGNNSDYDGCDANCLLEDGFNCYTTWTLTSTAASVDPDYDTATSCSEICGDGMNFNDDTTYCDAGTAGVATDGCTSTCAVVEGWYCGFGGYTTKDFCYEECGDTYNWGALQCDDVGTDLEGCSSSCEQEDGWYCLFNGDFTPATLVSYSTAAHECFEQCGDGLDFGHFDCDDGNTAIDDGCNAACGLEVGWGCAGGDSTGADTCYELCGDAYNLNTLPCDDGNDVEYDGCYECVVEEGWYCPDYLVTDATFAGTYSTHYEPNFCYDICGDGLLVDDSMYTCDDYDNTDGDGCSAKCQIERGHYCKGGDRSHRDYCYETCGDGFNFPSTTGDCDDGGLTSGDGCSIKCEIEDGWYCYGGSSSKRDYCYELCGDDYDFESYGCDDGNTNSNDGCSSACAVETGWECYGGSSTGNDYCYDSCGDGKHQADGVSATAYCDDGNADETDGCTSSCVVLDGWVCSGGDSTGADSCTEVCGDGIDYGTDECDDGNIADNDGCTSSCYIETGYDCTGGNQITEDTCIEICGDGLDLGTFACDDGDTYDNDGCNSSCEEESGYDCTGGTSSAADVCEAVCGDGLLRAQETCDDTNTSADDGCDSDCVIEFQYTCTGEPSVCTEICGDGYDMGHYECDDGNVDDYDGCTSNCDVETGFTCTGGTTTAADVCAPICGDGLVRSVETCDDENTYDNDGCSSDCLVETEYDCNDAEPSVCEEICGDGLNMGQVQCDDGDNTSGDGCSSSCEVEEGWKCSGGTHSTADTCEETDYISPSVTECAEFAAKFSTTCTEDVTDEAQSSFDLIQGETQTCEDNYGGLCAGSKTMFDMQKGFHYWLCNDQSSNQLIP